MQTGVMIFMLAWWIFNWFDLSWFDRLNTNNWLNCFWLAGIWQEGSDGTDINTACRSHSGAILATGDDFGKINLFNYPVIQPKVGHQGEKLWSCGLFCTILSLEQCFEFWLFTVRQLMNGLFYWCNLTLSISLQSSVLIFCSIRVSL